MNDYAKMRVYLEGMDQAAIVTFCHQVDWRIPVLNDTDDQYGRDEFGGVTSQPYKLWRGLFIKDALALREANPARWNELCYAAGIETDAQAGIRTTKEALELASREAKWNRRGVIVAIVFGLTGIVWQFCEHFLDSNNESGAYKTTPTRPSTD